jgi:hypothetical protein
VTWPGSPPNAAMLARVQRSAVLRIADDPEDVVKIIKEAHTDLEF